MDLLEMANAAGRRLSQALPRLHVGLPKSPRPGLSECASQSLRRGMRVWLTALAYAPGAAPSGRTREPWGSNPAAARHPRLQKKNGARLWATIVLSETRGL